MIGLALALGVGGVAAASNDHWSDVAATPSPSPSVVPSPSVSAPPSPAGLDPAVLRLPGTVPAKGAGTFLIADGTGPVLGTGGRLRTYRVAVEDGSGENPADVAETVDRTLGDPLSWPGDGSLRLQRVAGDADFTIHLATRDTAYRMCLAGGTDIRMGGVPYTSCRTGGHVIVNLDRWRLSAAPYVDAGVPLATYRQYVINHETGHELGHGHEGCPAPGQPAPVMVQQTITLRGCVPAPWPLRDGRRYVGPALPGG